MTFKSPSRSLLLILVSNRKELAFIRDDLRGLPSQGSQEQADHIAPAAQESGVRDDDKGDKLIHNLTLPPPS